MAKRVKTDEKATGTRQEAQVPDAPAADASVADASVADASDPQANAENAEESKGEERGEEIGGDAAAASDPNPSLRSSSDSASLRALDGDPDEVLIPEEVEPDLDDPEVACGFILCVVLRCEGVPDDHAGGVGGNGGAGDGLQDMSIDELEREMDRIDVRSSEIAAARSGLSNAVTSWRAICKLVDASLRKQQGELSTIETHHSRIDLERARLASALRTKRIDERRAVTS